MPSNTRFMKRRRRLPAHPAWLLALAAFATPASVARSAEFDAHGFIALGAQDAPNLPSWGRGGLGRYLGDGDIEASLQAHLGLHWESDLNWDGFLHLRADSRVIGGHAIGIVEATISRRWFFAGDQRLSLTAGQMFLPTTREAIDPLWQSRYTLTLSALNSWIAEEVRPLGLQAALRSSADAAFPWEFGAVAFSGSDSAGALLAWRGFALHDRLSVYNEQLPLPALPSLANGGAFSEQNDAGSKPFGRDLDGRPGWAAHAHWGQADAWQVRGAVVDTRGDRDLHRGEYAWDTRFTVVGADWQLHPQLQLVGEWMRGRSGMGSSERPAMVDIDFNAAYLLASWSPDERWRWSLRWDRFNIEDRDHSAAEDNSDHGDGFTLAGFRTVGEHWRLGAEWSQIDSRHAASADLGVDAETGGGNFRLEARYFFF